MPITDGQLHYERMDLIKKIEHFFSYWYVRYLLATELYMVEPWEKVAVHALFFVLFGIVWIFNYSVMLGSVSHLRSSVANWHILSLS